MTKAISVAKGMKALLDSKDFAAVSKFDWTAWKIRGRIFVARTVLARGARKKQYLHAFLLKPGRGKNVIFLSGNRLDFRRKNLAVTDAQGRSAHRKISKKGNSSRYRGVSWHKKSGRWQAVIKNREKLEWLGNFSSQKEAAHAYDKRAKQLYGKFASLNF
jgi:hypothetical protein